MTSRGWRFSVAPCGYTSCPRRSRPRAGRRCQLPIGTVRRAHFFVLVAPQFPLVGGLFHKRRPVTAANADMRSVVSVNVGKIEEKLYEREIIEIIVEANERA